ncbi:hypothetical protein CBW18_18130 [Pedobacter sp. AJM]|nr:hypothetical protein CBW18_18130 [Pedobacter sp. AJM]
MELNLFGIVNNGYKKLEIGPKSISKGYTLIFSVNQRLNKPRSLKTFIGLTKVNISQFLNPKRSKI